MALRSRFRPRCSIIPCLQVADIILYDADLVPVGEDQRQHIELARDVAQRFNRRYGDTFVVPAPDIKTSGARIMSLEDPTKKMSKSAGSAGSYVALTDTDSEITKKIKRAVTDSGSEVKAAPDKPALTNLLGIYSLLSNEPIAEIEDRYAGKGYGAFKTDLGDDRGRCHPADSRKAAGIRSESGLRDRYSGRGSRAGARARRSEDAERSRADGSDRAHPPDRRWRTFQSLRSLTSRRRCHMFEQLARRLGVDRADQREHDPTAADRADPRGRHSGPAAVCFWHHFQPQGSGRELARADERLLRAGV